MRLTARIHYEIPDNHPKNTTGFWLKGEVLVDGPEACSAAIALGEAGYKVTGYGTEQFCQSAVDVLCEAERYATGRPYAETVFIPMPRG